MSSTIRINNDVKEMLKNTALQKGISIQAALKEAIELYGKTVFFDKLNAAYMGSNKDKKFKMEIEEMDSTLSDGLEEDGQ